MGQPLDSGEMWWHEWPRKCEEAQPQLGQGFEVARISAEDASPPGSWSGEETEFETGNARKITKHIQRRKVGT